MGKYSIFSSENIILCALNGIGLISLFVNGIGLDFGINCDYACLKHKKYTIDFRRSAGKLPDKGNKKYYVTDNDCDGTKEKPYKLKSLWLVPISPQSKNKNNKYVLSEEQKTNFKNILIETFNKENMYLF
jgi:hypothetical protein